MYYETCNSIEELNRLTDKLKRQNEKYVVKPQSLFICDDQGMVDCAPGQLVATYNGENYFRTDDFSILYRTLTVGERSVLIKLGCTHSFGYFEVSYGEGLKGCYDEYHYEPVKITSRTLAKKERIPELSLKDVIEHAACYDLIDEKLELSCFGSNSTLHQLSTGVFECECQSLCR